MMRGVEGAEGFGAEAEALDRAGGEVLDEDVGVCGEVFQQGEAARAI